MYKTSTDYGRLWELIKPTSVDQRSSGILCRARYGDNNQHLSPWFLCPTGGNFVGESEAFSAHCEKARIEFIDPASQQKTPEELAAGEMADVLQWALDAMPPSLLDYYYCKELVKKAEEVLKKARGEA